MDSQSSGGKENSLAYWAVDVNPEQDTDDAQSLQSSVALDSARDIDLALAQERHTEITHINQSMRKINEINQDLAFLVHEQQDDIDEMEEHIIETHDRLDNGVVQLRSASKWASSGGRIKMIVLLMFLVVLLILVLYFCFR
eukprot:CAMPEP_0195518518 /NCGR_PEP_ID=MMETSP0794_2-20130614/13043_1 /TAXON_ID=515487 /ORGANISM="Stephanopyxis turris, Strain CCMP 815" /LENGTH=140 /DNA_ID=CAMNT_0040647495 /DNA_START=355 /DNA_END=777 /DNA_ORIENTATION=+